MGCGLPALEKCLKLGINNFSLVYNDIEEHLKGSPYIKFIFLMYYIHHIQKDSEKIIFLKKLFDLLPKKGYLCIAEPFFDNDDTDYIKFKNRWNLVEEETYAKKFWTSLNSIDDKSIEYSKIYAQKAKSAEIIMGENYIKTVDEYLVTFDWMKDICKKIGFKVVLNERTNCFSDGIFLLKKL